MKAATPHLSSALVADLLDERLDPVDREIVVSHLAACADCRHEVAELHGALDRLGTRRPRARRLAGVGLVAAAIIGLVSIPSLIIPHRTVGESPGGTRNGDGVAVESAARIAIVAPLEDGRTSSSFVWRSAGAASSYLLTVQDSAGVPVWTAPTTDTVISLPSNIKLVHGARYFWSVDARLGDGTSSSSGSHAFTAR